MEEITVNIIGLNRFERHREKEVIKLIEDGYYAITDNLDGLDIHYVSSDTHYGVNDNDVETIGDKPYVIGTVDDNQTILINYSGSKKRLFMLSTSAALATLLSLEYSKYIDSGVDINEEKDDQLAILMAGLSTFFTVKMLASVDNKYVNKYIKCFDYINENTIHDSIIDNIVAMMGATLANGGSVAQKFRNKLISSDERLYNVLVELEIILSTIYNTVFEKQIVNRTLFMNAKNQIKIMSNLVANK